MNKLFCAALAAVPAICVTSCSDSLSSAVADADALKDEIKDCIKEYKDAKDEELIEALHACVVPRLESIADAMEDMSSDEKSEFMIKFTVKENNTLDEISKIIKEELKHRFDTKNEKRVWKKLSKKSKLQLIEIGEAAAKIAVTYGFDLKAIKKTEKAIAKRQEEEFKKMKAAPARRDYERPAPETDFDAYSDSYDY